MATAAAVWVDVLPSMSSFPGTLNRQLSGVGAKAGQQVGTEMGDTLGRKVSDSVSGAGTRAGSKVGAEMGGAVASALPRSMAGASRAFDSFYNSAATRASAAGSRVSSSMGGAMMSVLTPIGRVRDGFGSAEAAASSFSGRAGTIGGYLRRGFDTGAAAASGFANVTSGVMGRVSAYSAQFSGQAGKSLRSPFAGVSGMLSEFGIAGGLALGGLGAAAVVTGVKFNATQEQARIAFTTMLGSGQRAATMMDQLNAFAARTPFELNNTTQAAQRLMAYGFRAEQVIPTLTAIGDAVSGLGGSAQQLDQVTTAVGQMMAKGKVQSDELLQLTEAGVPALRILANQYGVNAGQMQDMITKGQIVADEAIPKLLAGMEQGTNGAAGATQAFGGMMERQSHSLAGMWSNFTDNFQRTMGNLFTPIMPAIQGGLDWLTGAMGNVPSVLGNIAPIFSSLYNAMRPFVEGFGQGFLNTFRFLGQFFTSVLGPALQWVTGLFGDMSPGMQTVSRIAGVLVGAVASLVTVYWTIRAATLAWAAATSILSAAMNVNPIGLAVIAIAALVGGVIYAWNHFEWFRTAVTATWDAISTGAQWVWTNVLQPVFSAIGTAVTAVGSFFTWLWTSAIVPAWNAIGTAISWAWSTVIKPVLDAIWLGLRFLGAIVFTVLVTPLWLAWQAISAGAQWLWGAVLSPVFEWIKTGFGLVGSFFGWVWTTLIQPAWTALGIGISWVWATIIKPCWDALTAALGAVGGFFSWVWTTVIQPVWNALGAGIAWVWAWVIKPSWDALTAALGGVGAFFSWVWNAVISPVWNALGMGISWVWQNVIRPAFDAIKDAVHWVGQAFENVSNWIGDVWRRVADFAAKPVGFVVNVVYNQGIRPVWNWIQDKFGLNLALPEMTVPYAGGGLVPGYAPGRDTVPAMLSPGEAVLTPEAVRAIGPGTILGLNRSLSGRKPASGAGGTVHAAGGWLSDIWNVASGLAGGAWRGIKDIAAAVADLAAKPLDWIKGQLSPFTNGLAAFGDSPWLKGLKAIPGKFIDAAVAKVQEWFSSSGGAYGAMAVAAPGGGVQRWAPLVLQALAMMGQPASLLNVVLRRMQQESGGNPNIGNFWDSNAAKGTPSMGLMQVIGPTFASYRDPRAPNNILDPLANILASMRYAIARYGSLAAAYNKPGGYRNGGWLMPGELAYNETRRPEPILSAEQWDSVRRGARGGDGTQITVNARTEASPELIAREIDRHVAMSKRL